MKTIILSFTILLLFSCKINSQEVWQKIEYYYRTGKVAPENFYAYQITINPDMSASFQYDVPSTFGKEPKYYTTFTISPEQWGSITSYIDLHNILEREFSEPDIKTTDGPQEYATFYFYPADDPKMGLTPLQKMTPKRPLREDEKLFEDLYSKIKAVVPESVWNAAGITGTQSQTQQMNGSEFSEIQYFYSTGPLPPPYHYHYSISINSKGLGVLEYHSGYESQNEHQQYNYDFTVTAEDMGRIKNALNEMKIYTTTIPALPADKTPVGGSTDYIKIVTVNPDPNLDQPPNVIQAPAFPEESYKQGLENIYTLIKNTVPEEVWSKVNLIKDAQEKEN